MKFATIAMVFFSASQVYAEICDYRPSQLTGDAITGAAVAGGAAVAAAGVGAKAAGIYTLVHASSGLTMLASTAGGASAEPSGLWAAPPA